MLCVSAHAVPLPKLTQRRPLRRVPVLSCLPKKGGTDNSGFARESLRLNPTSRRVLQTTLRLTTVFCWIKQNPCRAVTSPLSTAVFSPTESKNCRKSNRWCLCTTIWFSSARVNTEKRGNACTRNEIRIERSFFRPMDSPFHTTGRPRLVDCYMRQRQKGIRSVRKCSKQN